MPKVSVGMPFYNVETTLRDAVGSIFAQTFQDWELILMDDGSTDSSLEIAISIDDPRVKVITDGENLGIISQRRNQIIGMAHGKYLAWLDADDMMHPNRLAAQVEMLESDPSIDVVDSGMYGIDCYEPVGVTYLHKMVSTPESAFKRSLVAQGSAMGRLEWFRNNPSNTERKRAEDFSLWARTIAHSKFARVYLPLTFCKEATFTPSQTLAKYKQSQGDMRAITRKYGPATIGRASVAKRLMASHCKVVLYTVFTVLGQQRRLINTRGVVLGDAEKAEARAIIDQIRRTPVPGLTEPDID